MKKILVIFIITISSIFSFSAKPMEKKKLGGEVKLMLHAGYDPLILKKTDIALSLSAYKKYDVKSIDALINVGGGIDFLNYFDGDFYDAGILGYFAAEVGGYLNPNTRLFAGTKLGAGSLVGDTAEQAFPKAGLVVGMTYKENFTVELEFSLPSTFTIGFGSRFGF